MKNQNPLSFFLFLCSACRYLIKLPTPGSDPNVVEAKGPEAGERYKKAKYGDDDEEDDNAAAPPEEESAGGGKCKKKKTQGALADLAAQSAANDVPPNFNLLVVFALGLLRALLRKMSGEARRQTPNITGPDRNRIYFHLILCLPPLSG